MKLEELIKEEERIAPDEYINIRPSGKATLDGSFSAQQLREIADLMEKYQKE